MADFDDISNIKFSAELLGTTAVPQTEMSPGCWLNLTDVGAGFPNSFLSFDLGNFKTAAGVTVAWNDASNIKVTVWVGDYVDGAGTATYNVGADMNDAGGFMGWAEWFAVGGFPIMVQPGGGVVVPEVIIDDMGNVTGPDVTGSGNGWTPWGSDIPYDGNIGIWFELLLDDADFPLTYRITMDQSGMLPSQIPGQLGWRILPAGAWTFIPAVAPFQLAWQDMGTANAYYDIIIAGGKAGRAPVSVGVALSTMWDWPLPVTLTSFLVSQTQGSQFATIAWTVQSESNMQHYNLYRSESSLENALNIKTIDAVNSSELYTYSHVDEYEIAYATTYYYWLEGVEVNGHSAILANGEVTIEEPNVEVPVLSDVTKLHSNYPNPFNPTTTIKYFVKAGETATLQIFNAKGQLVQTATLNETTINGGTYTFEGSKYGSGIYFYRLKTDNYSEVKKMMMLK
jgi:hypothetical protein